MMPAKLGKRKNENSYPNNYIFFFHYVYRCTDISPLIPFAMIACLFPFFLFFVFILQFKKIRCLQTIWSTCLLMLILTLCLPNSMQLPKPIAHLISDIPYPALRIVCYIYLVCVIFVGFQQWPHAEIPYSYLVIAASTGKLLFAYIRIGCDRQYPVIGRCKNGRQLAVLYVVYIDASIIASADQCAAVWCKCQVAYRHVVSYMHTAS